MLVDLACKVVRTSTVCAWSLGSRAACGVPVLVFATLVMELCSIGLLFSDDSGVHLECTSFVLTLLSTTS